MNTPKCPGAAAPQTTGSVKPCGMEAARAARSCVPEPLPKSELTGSDAVASVWGLRPAFHLPPHSSRTSQSRAGRDLVCPKLDSLQGQHRPQRSH